MRSEGQIKSDKELAGPGRANSARKWRRQRPATLPAPMGIVSASRRHDFNFAREWPSSGPHGTGPVRSGLIQSDRTGSDRIESSWGRAAIADGVGLWNAAGLSDVTCAMIDGQNMDPPRGTTCCWRQTSLAPDRWGPSGGGWASSLKNSQTCAGPEQRWASGWGLKWASGTRTRLGAGRTRAPGERPANKQSKVKVAFGPRISDLKTQNSELGTWNSELGTGLSLEPSEQRPTVECGRSGRRLSSLFIGRPD